jgi:hypothetical protein
MRVAPGGFQSTDTFRFVAGHFEVQRLWAVDGEIAEKTQIFQQLANYAILAYIKGNG